MQRSRLNLRGRVGGLGRAWGRRWPRRRVVVPAASLGTLIAVGVLWSFLQGGRASSEGIHGDEPETRPRTVVPIIEPFGTAGYSTPTVTSRWEAERAALNRRTAGRTTTTTRSRGTAHEVSRATLGEAAAENEDDGLRARTSLGSHRPRPAPPSLQKSPAGLSLTLPVAAPGTAAARPPNRMDPTWVSAVVRSHVSEVQGCFDRAVMDNADLHGRLTIQATIDPAGHVRSVTPTNTLEHGARLQSCVVSAFQSWTFPPPEGELSKKITYSFAFQ